MPGPSNTRNKKKAKKKARDKRVNADPEPRPSLPAGIAQSTDSSLGEIQVQSSSQQITTGAKHSPKLAQSPLTHLTKDQIPLAHHSSSGYPPPLLHPEPSEVSYDDDPTFVFLQQRQPPIYDPGNGPRVRDMRAFLSSSFAHPHCSDDPLYAEFAQPEVLQMLRTVLPEETAMVHPSHQSVHRPNK